MPREYTVKRASMCGWLVGCWASFRSFPKVVVVFNLQSQTNSIIHRLLIIFSSDFPLKPGNLWIFTIMNLPLLNLQVLIIHTTEILKVYFKFYPQKRKKFYSELCHCHMCVWAKTLPYFNIINILSFRQ